ncbi:MAG TPA: hypothetical protein VHX13_02080 [Acidobacteriaceae bacterium]|jgi:hypothetical protein|nr:hypothetical protein [Acidobacteriaceae bacterium]
MEKAGMSPAARVRREFRLGRPPRPLPDGAMPEQLHPAVTWQRAKDALADFRRRMADAKLKPEQVDAAIIYVTRAYPERPCFLRLEDSVRPAALNLLAREDVIALGMLFVQFDARAKQRTIFPHLFFGLNQRGMAVLKEAAALEYTAGAVLKDVHEA